MEWICITKIDGGYFFRFNWDQVFVNLVQDKPSLASVFWIHSVEFELPTLFQKIYRFTLREFEFALKIAEEHNRLKDKSEADKIYNQRILNAMKEQKNKLKKLIELRNDRSFEQFKVEL